MRLALICMAGALPAPPKKAPELPLPPEVLETCQNLEMAQTMAISRRLLQTGAMEPLIICPKGEKLATAAKREELPCLPVSRALNPISLFGLWRWQKKTPWLPILVVGADGLILGRRLAAMRKPGHGQLNAAFLLRPPTHTRPRDLAAIEHILSGSGLIAENIEETLQTTPSKGEHIPQLLECPPGMALDGYTFSLPFYDEEKDLPAGKHFVFGMAGSLLPESGALLVARAMAAIWQRTDLPPWEIRMFGSGPRFEEILREARILGVESRLSLLSDQPLPEVTRLCHAWLAPGRSFYELPQILWAGFAAGLPVICSQSELHKERLKFAEPSASLRVGRDNPQELARAMIGVMRNGRLRQHLVESATEIRPQISLEAMAERVCGHLQNWVPKESKETESANTEEGKGDV